MDGSISTREKSVSCSLASSTVEHLRFAEVVERMISFNSWNRWSRSLGSLVEVTNLKSTLTSSVDRPVKNLFHGEGGFLPLANSRYHSSREECLHPEFEESPHYLPRAMVANDWFGTSLRRHRQSSCRCLSITIKFSFAVRSRVTSIFLVGHWFLLRGLRDIASDMTLFPIFHIETFTGNVTGEM